LLRNRVGQLGRIFPCTLRKNYALDPKMKAIFFDGLDELYHCAKFGEDRTTCAGCRCENVLFVTMFYFCHAPRPARCSLEGNIVRTCVALPFIGRFQRGFHRFFQKGLLFQMHYTVLIFVVRWRHNFWEIAVKNCEKSKNRRKSLCAPLSTLYR